MFEPGKIYVRKDIHKQFGGQHQYGISTPSGYPMIFVFSSDTGEIYGYKDEWMNKDIFLYTGQGQSGDMEFTRGNKAIRDHKRDGKEIHLFKVLGSGKVHFISKMELEKYLIEEGKDHDGNKRKMIRVQLVKTT